MRVKICLILIFMFSFFSSNFVKEVSAVDSTILDTIKDELYCDSNFVENGVKVIYRSHLKKEDEIESVKKQLEKNFNRKVMVTNDEIDIWTSFGEIKADFFFNNNETIVDLSIINDNKELSISKLMKELTQLQSKNIYNIRYFQYIKGTINNKDDALNKIKKVQQIKNIDTLDIHNGYVGTANFYDGERVNIAINSYDTGNYLIIGTPVIFTTY